MRVIILGAGLVGQAIAFMLSKEESVEELAVVDVDRRNLSRARRLVGDIRIFEGDVVRYFDIIAGYDVACCALPGNISYSIVRIILSMGVSVVDSSFMPQDPFSLTNVAQDNNVVYVPDAGFAPGLSNMFVGRFYRELGDSGTINIYVGGLPQRPEGIFRHKVNWSLVDFVEEYVRPARIIRDGKLVEVDPLSSIEKIRISGEEFEAFFTDGLRTLLKTIKARNMAEKTIRYLGHLEKMLMIREMGLLKNETIRINGKEIKTRDILLWILKRTIYDTDMKDRAILYIQAKDKYNKNFREVLLEDSYDEKLKLSAMAKLTGFTNAIITILLSKIKTKGVLPPETIGMDYLDTFLDKFLENSKIRLRKAIGIEINA